MGWLKNSIIFAGSWVALAISVLWVLSDGGYEPWIVATVSLVTILINFDYFPIFRRRKPRLTPEQRIAARDKWRRVFQDYFLQAASRGQRVGDAIVHDVSRLDTYPDAGKEKGISSWFRVGLMGTYNHGILLGLRWTYVEQKDGAWVENWKERTDASVKVILLGQVPYEAIESVNFDGDHYYSKPHIYCHFDYQGQPYEKLYYGEEFKLDARSPSYYREIVDFKSGDKWNFWCRK